MTFATLYTLADPRGDRDAPPPPPQPPPGSKFFHFHAVFGKKHRKHTHFGSWRPQDLPLLQSSKISNEVYRDS